MRPKDLIILGVSGEASLWRTQNGHPEILTAGVTVDGSGSVQTGGKRKVYGVVKSSF